MMEVEHIGAVLVTMLKTRWSGSFRNAISFVREQVSADLSNFKAKELMSRNLVTCTPESTLAIHWR